MTIRRAPTLKTGTFSRFQFGESEREDIVYKKQLKKPHALGRQTSEREELHYKKNCIRNNHSTPPHSPSPNFECEELQYKKKALKSHQGNYTETEVKVWKKQHTIF